MNNNPEDTLKGITIADPSENLKRRVLGAARTEWSISEQDEDISWFYPVLRLAASVAITFAALGVAGQSDEQGRQYAQFFSPPSTQRMELAPEFEFPSAGLGLVVDHSTIGLDPNSLLQRQAQLLELLTGAKIENRDSDGACVRQIRDAALS